MSWDHDLENPQSWIYGGASVTAEWLRTWGPRGRVARDTRESIAADRAAERPRHLTVPGPLFTFDGLEVVAYRSPRDGAVVEIDTAGTPEGIAHPQITPRLVVMLNDDEIYDRR